MGETAGVFPKWPLVDGDSGSMVGASAEVVLADAYLKGITDFDAKGAYAILRAAAMDTNDPPAGRGGRGSVLPYMQLGYVPATSGGSVSLTLEYAQDDFALGNLAAALGEQADADALRARSLGYRKLYDPDTGFLRGRLADGSLDGTSFDPVNSAADYVEANGWQSLWVAHDVDGMIGLFGSRQALIDKLEMFFELSKMEWDSLAPKDGAKLLPRPYYWAGNEPDLHAVYLFAQAGRPDLTQKWLKWIMATFYGTGADGLPGNDDGGTMSAWYVFSALGFYPLAGSDRYVVGAPLFPHAEIAVAGGSFTIDAPAVSDANIYVQSVELNGQPLAAPELRHADLRPGGTLQFTMGPQPGNWGRAP
jgi:predicted alpha-1,2-mannosidase